MPASRSFAIVTGASTGIGCKEGYDLLIAADEPEIEQAGLKLWKAVKAKNPRSGRKMSDAIFIANRASGRLAIGDKQEIDKATWHKPCSRGIRLTPTSSYIRDKLFPQRG
jgi:8-oxo-dGTP diphosphatase